MRYKNSVCTYQTTLILRENPAYIHKKSIHTKSSYHETQLYIFIEVRMCIECICRTIRRDYTIRNSVPYHNNMVCCCYAHARVYKACRVNALCASFVSGNNATFEQLIGEGCLFAVVMLLLLIHNFRMYINSIARYQR